MTQKFNDPKIFDSNLKKPVSVRKILKSNHTLMPCFETQKKWGHTVKIGTKAQ